MASAPRGKANTRQEAQIQEQPLGRVNRDLAILNMRLHGLTFFEIARKLPDAGFKRVSVSRVYAIVAKALHSSPHAPARDLRDLELMRLDQLQAAHYKQALKGDATAAQRVLAIIDRRAKLLGLDASLEAETSLDDARKTLIQKLEQLARGQSKKDTNANR